MTPVNMRRVVMMHGIERGQQANASSLKVEGAFTSCRVGMLTPMISIRHGLVVSLFGGWARFRWRVRHQNERTLTFNIGFSNEARMYESVLNLRTSFSSQSPATNRYFPPNHQSPPPIIISRHNHKVKGKQVQRLLEIWAKIMGGHSIPHPIIPSSHRHKSR